MLRGVQRPGVGELRGEVKAPKPPKGECWGARGEGKGMKEGEGEEEGKGGEDVSYKDSKKCLNSF